MRSILLIINIFFILASCGRQAQEAANTSITNDYAKHFSLEQKDGYTLLEIKNPWIDAQNINYRYAITETSQAQIPDDLNIIHTEPERVAAISTTHIAFLEQLNRLGNLVAVSDKQFIYSRRFHHIDSTQGIKEVGFDTNLNIEKLLQLKVKLVFLYGISNEIEPIRKRLIRAGIVPVMIGEYMEQHPLGKAEWIKVFGAIFNQENEAQNFFDSVSNAYLQLANMTDTLKSKPTVFTGMPWNDTWHTPGGNTYTAKLIEDAGASYVFKNDTSSVNFQYDTEIVYERAGEADYWINPGAAASLKDIVSQDTRLELFNAYQNGKVFNNNRRALPSGGSDYMESGVVNPHLILGDLIRIFHPNKVSKKSFHYYQQLK
ncbi:ABC transporter substrate-binding protein [Salinivirga cyanobacteriivorans]